MRPRPRREWAGTVFDKATLCFSFRTHDNRIIFMFLVICLVDSQFATSFSFPSENELQWQITARGISRIPACGGSLAVAKPVAIHLDCIILIIILIILIIIILPRLYGRRVGLSATALFIGRARRGVGARANRQFWRTDRRHVAAHWCAALLMEMTIASLKHTR